MAEPAYRPWPYPQAMRHRCLLLNGRLAQRDIVIAFEPALEFVNVIVFFWCFRAFVVKVASNSPRPLRKS